MFISEKKIRSIITMGEAINSMRSAFIKLSRNDVSVPKRINIQMPDKNATALVMPAYVFGSPYYTVKIVSINYDNLKKNLPLIHSMVEVFDAFKGSLVATMDGSAITALRTGAASGLATDLLAKKEAKVMAIFGTGIQAKTQVESILTVRNITNVLIFSRTKKNAESFHRWISKIFGVDAECSKLSQLNQADIICTATPSEKPLFNHDHINPGVHINAIGSFEPHMREIPTSTIKKSKVVVDQKDACQEEAGDLIIPAKSGQWDFKNIYGELGQIADNKLAGRDGLSEITLFKSVGNAIQDHALASLILGKL